MIKQKHPPTVIIGAGAVGTSLAVSLHRKGYPIVGVISKSLLSAKVSSKKVKCRIASTKFEAIPPSTKLIIITVPDNSLAEVDKQLSRVSKLDFKQLLVVHTSGINPASILKQLKKKGALIAAVHPIQTFPKQTGNKLKPVPFDGVYFGVDCSSKAKPKITRLVKSLNGNVIFIPEHLRPLYHAACVFSSSYMVVLANAIAELSKSLQIEKHWFEIFQPLFTTALKNTAIASAGASLTGPVIRKDIRTLKKHNVSIKKYTPELLPLYTHLAQEVARIAKQTKRITPKEYKKIISINSL